MKRTSTRTPHSGNKKQNQPKRLNTSLFALAVALLLAASIPFTASAQYQTVVAGGYIVEFDGIQQDEDLCRTYFFYTISNNGSSPDISNFILGKPQCAETCLNTLPDGYYGTWEIVDGVIELSEGDGKPKFDTDDGTGVCGIRFEDGVTGTNSQQVFVAVDGLHEPGEINMLIKAGTNDHLIEIPGPDDCTSNCSVGGSTFTSAIDDEGFENGFGIWNDGGDDCAISDQYPASGDSSLMLRDNSSDSYAVTDVLDLSTYSEITVEFSYLTVSFDRTTEDFLLEISTDGGDNFTTVEDWAFLLDFLNLIRMDESVTISGPFTDETMLRFTSDASHDDDIVYIDDIVITGQRYDEFVHLEGCAEYYDFRWYNGNDGASWEITNGESSVTRSFEFADGTDSIAVDVTMDNSDGVAIDASQCTLPEASKYYTATADADFGGLGCSPETYYRNFSWDHLTMGMVSGTSDDELSMTFEFDKPVQVQFLTISDIDFNHIGSDAETYHDEVMITASRDGIAVPVRGDATGDNIVVDGDSSVNYTAYARSVAATAGDRTPFDQNGFVTISTMGLVDAITISLSNSRMDDGSAQGMAIGLSSFNLCTGAPNQVPVCVADSFQVERNTNITGSVLDDNGFGADYKGDDASITVTITQAPLHGSLTMNPDGSFEYTPDPGYMGRDFFAYSIEDANGDIAYGEVTLYIKDYTDEDAIGDIADIDDDNDGIIDVMEVCKDTSVQYTDLSVEVITDGQPFEISWEMTDPDGRLVDAIENGDMTDPEEPYVRNMQVITSGTYRFTIEDLYGDGLTDINGRTTGSYRISRDGLDLYSGIPNFGHRQVVEVEIADKVFTCKSADPSADSDGDGIVNFRDPDYCTLSAQGVCDDMDSDADGIPDFLDLDSDNDGIPDNIEGQPTQSFIHPLTVDVDGDGLDDAYDRYMEGARTSLASEGILPVDTDADGTPDYLDLDSDDDGYLDEIESGLSKESSDSDFDGMDNGVDITSDYRVPYGIISNPAFLPDEDGDVVFIGGDVDFRDINAGLLPVELVFFTAIANGNNAVLQWQTASEVNNDYFSVQRSKDIVHWEEIGTVDGHGNTAEINNYEHIDADLDNGVYYYRLQQFDFDGTSEFSDTRSVVIGGAPDKDRSLEIFPNPAQVSGDVVILGLETDGLVRLYDAGGTQLAEFTTVDGRFDLSGASLPAGIYLVEVAGVNASEMLKLVVNN